MVMDLEDRIRDAVRPEGDFEPGPSFRGRIMAGLDEVGWQRPHGLFAHRGALQLGAIAATIAIAVAAVGVPLMATGPIAEGPSLSASPSEAASASPTTQEASVSPLPARPSDSPAMPGTPEPSQSAFPTQAPVETHAPSSQFSPTASTAFFFDSATALADGRVLVACGFDPAAGFLSQAEIYDPATQQFTPTGSMGTARASGTATRLSDGRVLLAGGLDSGYMDLASAEIYDPAAGKFGPTGSMTIPRQFHTATLLKDGRVLIAGGFTENLASAAAYHPGDAGSAQAEAMTLPKGLLASAEIYDPTTGTFTQTGYLRHARDHAAAALLQDGRVLIFGNSGGGDGGDRPTDKTAEIYDPATGEFSLTGSLQVARSSPRATVLTDGRVLVTGGAADGRSAEIYDPATGEFTLTGSTSVARTDAATALLADGRVLVVGGSAPYPGNALSSAEIYDPAMGRFSLTGWMTTARSTPLTARLAGGRVLIVGGIYVTDAGWEPIYSAEIYRP
jgi:hypothetical protein